MTEEHSETPGFDVIWEKYDKQFVPADASAELRTMVRKAFLSGACVMFHILMGVVVEENDEPGLTEDEQARLETVTNEVESVEETLDLERLFKKDGDA
jgi:hypothetical protein